MTIPGSLEPDVDFGPYRVEAQLAIGGMATVWRAHHRAEPSRKVALKTMLPHLTEDQECVRMFLREAELGVRFDHPNIVSIHDVGVFDGLYFIEMEFL
ncbi:MAG: protein kinase, partial [Myxococcota bacterium]